MFISHAYTSIHNICIQATGFLGSKVNTTPQNLCESFPLQCVFQTTSHTQISASNCLYQYLKTRTIETYLHSVSHSLWNIFQMYRGLFHLSNKNLSAIAFSWFCRAFIIKFQLFKYWTQTVDKKWILRNLSISLKYEAKMKNEFVARGRERWELCAHGQYTRKSGGWHASKLSHLVMIHTLQTQTTSG